VINVPAWLAAIGITETALQAATIQGFFALLGIILAGLLASFAYGRNRSADRRMQRDLRAEKARDLQSALRAEVRGHWYELEGAGPSTATELQVIERIDEGRWTQPSFTPYVPKTASSIILDAIVADIALLDHDVVELTIRYYRQVALVAQMVEDLRTPFFGSLSADRKIEMVRAYFAMQRNIQVAAAELNGRLETAMRLRRNQRDANMRGQAVSAGSRAARPYPGAGATTVVAPEQASGRQGPGSSAALRNEP